MEWIIKPALTEPSKESVAQTDEIVSVGFQERESKTDIHNFDSLICKRVLRLEDPTLTVQIGAFAFKTNMEVLEIYSKYIRKHNDLKEIVLPEAEVSPLAFVALYEWMIAKNPGLPRKGVVELYKAASFLEIPQFLAQFWECVSNTHIIEERAYLMYLEALAFQIPTLRSAMLNRISRFFLPIVSCDEFLHIPIEDLRTLLKSNLIGVNSEIEVYFSCVRYFSLNWEDRKDYLLPVMKLIHFDFLPTNFLLELLNEESEVVTKKVSRMVDHPELQEIVRDLVHYHCLVAFPGPNTVSLEKSMHRFWIFDPQCDYHNSKSPRKRNSEFVRYLQFTSYMRSLSANGLKQWKNFTPINIESDSKDKNDLKWEII